MDLTERLIWAGGDVPPCLQQAAEGRWEIIAPSQELLLAEPAVGVVAAVLDDKIDGVEKVLRHLYAVGIVAIIIGKSTDLGHIDDIPLLRVGQDVSAEELRIRLDSTSAIRQNLLHTLDELAAAKSLAKYAARTADELDEEMRLASRLQQDFLPRQLPKVGQARFGVFFQPASFVSGDLYDAARLDETHVGFYIADAVGHGLPAALLTMFIKEALQTKRISGNTYEIIPPHEALTQLNTDLCKQQLTMCEFCTGLYAIVDTTTLMVTICRAGHPAPIHISGRKVQELDLPGPLLGIMEDAIFESHRFQLSAGDRLIIYSDGLEECFAHDSKHGSILILEEMQHLIGLPRNEFIQRISEKVNNSDVHDDVTVLVMDV